MEPLIRFLTLSDYNTRVVVLGCVMLGLAAGLIGPFMMLRKRSLLADATSHAMLPGIAIAFLIMHAATGNGKWLPGLLLGALVSGLLGMLTIIWINRHSRLQDDTALAVVLSVFYGFGAALLGLIQKLENADAAGLSSFIIGKTASMRMQDALLIAICALIIAVLVILFFKEFAVLCFDSDFARSQGWPVAILDVIMMGIVVVTTVIGLRAVGLVLMIALLVTPAAAARFWTQNLKHLLWISGAFGAASCYLGAMWSSTQANVSAGASMVLCASAIFIFSLLFGPAKGIVLRLKRQAGMRQRTLREHLLRGIYEHEESTGQVGMTPEQLFPIRGWGRFHIRRAARDCEREGLVYMASNGRVTCTEEGRIESRRLARNHRLWELYMMEYADVAPSHVDRSADQIEHVLGTSLIARLEAMLPDELIENLPDSPHVLQGAEDAT